MGMIVIERKETKKVFQTLENRFVDGGELISISEIVDEFLQPNSELSKLRAYRRVRSWMRQMKSRIWKKHRLPFGNIDNEGNYGVPTEENEYAFALKNYYTLTKGVVNNSKRFRDVALEKGLLTDRIREKTALLYEIQESLDKRGEEKRNNNEE